MDEKRKKRANPRKEGNIHAKDRHRNLEELEKTGSFQLIF